MSCRDCRHRLDMTLWGVWLASGCGKGLPLRIGCNAWSARLNPSAGLLPAPTQLDRAQGKQ